MLDIFHERKSAKNLIVFIHGLSGDRDTWINSWSKSFPDMLLENNIIKNKFNIAHFEYFSSLLPSSITFQEIKDKAKKKISLFFNPQKIEINLDIKRISRLLLTELETRAKEYKSIYIIAHSMGGLVAKQLIVNNSDNEIVKRIKLVVSLAVPHNGSSLATFGSAVYPLVQIKDLNPLSQVINETNQGWIDNKTSNPKIVYFQGAYDTVVAEASSKGYDANKHEVKFCDETHTSICKPESLSSIVYISVLNLLLEDVQKEQIEKKLVVKEKPDLSEIDDEDFVIKLIIADVNSAIITNSKKRFYEAELARKVFYQLGLKNEIKSLYDSIEQIYHNAFADVVSGKIADGNGLVAYVHNKITDENENLLHSLSKIKFTHKIGMMHQIANLDDEIWWARNHSTADIEKYKQGKKQAGA